MDKNVSITSIDRKVCGFCETFLHLKFKKYQVVTEYRTERETKTQICRRLSYEKTSRESTICNELPTLILKNWDCVYHSKNIKLPRRTWVPRKSSNVSNILVHSGTFYQSYSWSAFYFNSPLFFWIVNNSWPVYLRSKMKLYFWFPVAVKQPYL